VGPRTGLDEWRKFLTLPGLELQPLGRPARRTIRTISGARPHTCGVLNFLTLADGSVLGLYTVYFVGESVRR
jgi:hypothetical protein